MPVCYDSASGKLTYRLTAGVARTTQTCMNTPTSFVLRGSYAMGSSIRMSKIQPRLCSVLADGESLAST